jgi:hypothetical protein
VVLLQQLQRGLGLLILQEEQQKQQQEKCDYKLGNSSYCKKNSRKSATITKQQLTMQL